MLRPDLPGYLPRMFVAVRSNRVAFSSVQTACTSVVFPHPSGPEREVPELESIDQKHAP